MHASSVMPKSSWSRTTRCSAACTDHDRRAPRLDVWMSHGDHVAKAPPGFTVTAVTDRIPVAAMSLESKRWYGVQFHPEVTHTKQGTDASAPLRRRHLRLQDAVDGGTHHRRPDRARARDRSALTK